MAAFLARDYESALFFVDGAVTEDLENRADDTDQTPALLFMQLEGEKLNQAGKQLVEKAEREVRSLIDNYNGSPESVNPALLMDELRTSLLAATLDNNRPGWRSLATAFISFVLEWEDRKNLIDLRPGTGTAEPFFLRLFKGCLLFESLLKCNPSTTLTKDTLGKILRCDLSDKLRISPSIDIRARNFSDVVDDVRASGETIENAIEITGRIRNTTGHNIASGCRLCGGKYEKMFKMISSSYLHAIATLYR